MKIKLKVQLYYNSILHWLNKNQMLRSKCNKNAKYTSEVIKYFESKGLNIYFMHQTNKYC